MKKFVKKVVLFALISALCTAFISFAVFQMPDPYVNNYQRGFDYQFEALENSGADKKIVVAGGSYMAYSVNSAQLSEETGLPAYTVGIHSGMGMAYPLEVAKDHLNPGDIFVFCFNKFDPGEFGTDLIYISMQEDRKVFADFFRKHPFRALISLPSAASTRFFNAISNMHTGASDHDPITSIYDARAFDPLTGNLVYPRTECIANDNELPYVTLSASDISDECYAYLNDLYDYCSSIGVDMYIAFEPLYKDRVANSIEEIQEYQSEAGDILKAEVIVSQEDALVPRDYLYNGTSHMNDRGAEYYTHMLADGLKSTGTLQ